MVDENCKESKACFLPDESRSYLLSGKVFYFLTEKQVRIVDTEWLYLVTCCCIIVQYNRLHECITNGGGICQLVTSGESLSNLNELVGNNALVMSVDSNTFSSLDHTRKEWVQQVASFVKR